MSTIKSEIRNQAGRAYPSERFIRAGRQAGVTLIEMMITLVVFSLLVTGVYEVTTQTQTYNEHLNAWNEMMQWNQQAINEINLDLSSGRSNYQNDALGQAYLGQLQLDANYPVYTSTFLAVTDNTGTFHQDTTVSRTGNALLFVREGTPFTGTGGATTYRVDVYQLIYYYLSPVAQAIGNKATTLRLVKWTSKEFADYNQMMAITLTDRASFVTNLYNQRGIEYYWLPRNTPDTAFYHRNTTGLGDANNDGIDDAPSAAYIIQKKTVTSVIGSLGVATASVAWNRVNNFWFPDAVPKYANPALAGPSFPNGFEVQVIGPAGGRQILVRLVLTKYVTTTDPNNLDSAETQTIVDMQEH